MSFFFHFSLIIGFNVTRRIYYLFYILYLSATTAFLFYSHNNDLVYNYICHSTITSTYNCTDTPPQKKMLIYLLITIRRPNPTNQSRNPLCVACSANQKIEDHHPETRHSFCDKTTPRYYWQQKEVITHHRAKFSAFLQSLDDFTKNPIKHPFLCYLQFQCSSSFKKLSNLSLHPLPTCVLVSFHSSFILSFSVFKLKYTQNMDS